MSIATKDRILQVLADGPLTTVELYLKCASMLTQKGFRTSLQELVRDCKVVSVRTNKRLGLQNTYRLPLIHEFKPHPMPRPAREFRPLQTSDAMQRALSRAHELWAIPSRYAD